MLDSIWTSLLKLTEQFIIPDWTTVVALIPVALLALVGLWIMWTVRKFALAGPTRRGKRRIDPIPPPGTHAGAGSLAPILAAGGLFFVFWGLVVGGIAIPIGISVLILTLLYWGREGLAEFDHLVHAERLPAVVPRPAPPGVHMIGPSFRPILASLGMAVLFYGLVFGGWLLPVGVLLTIVALLGWLRDARAEWVKAVEADRTGHLEPLPAPRWPSTLLTIFAILLVGAVVLNLGILPPRGGGTSGGGAGASGQPAGSPATSGGPAGSGAPGPGGDVSIVAEGVKFTTAEVKAPAGKDFTIAFDNKDSGTPHDVDIHAADGSKVFDGAVVTGPKVQVYKVTALQAGTYKFQCSIHSNMSGTLTVQ